MPGVCNSGGSNSCSVDSDFSINSNNSFAAELESSSGQTLGRARSRASLKCQDSTQKGGVAGPSSQSYRTRQGGETAKNTAEGLTEG